MNARPSGAAIATGTASGRGTRALARSSCRYRGCATVASFPACSSPDDVRRRRWSLWVQEAYVQGISTRRVDDLVQALGMQGISKSQVSCLCAELDTEVERFRTRKLVGLYPYVWLDGTFVKVRDNGRVVSQAIVIAIGVTATGEREVLGLDVGPTESGAFWLAFLRSLVARGLSGVRLVISDAHGGLKAAIASVLQGAAWQRCRVHFIRDVLAIVPKSAQQMIAATIRTVFVQPDAALVSNCACRHTSGCTGSACHRSSSALGSS